MRFTLDKWHRKKRKLRRVSEYWCMRMAEYSRAISKMIRKKIKAMKFILIHLTTWESLLGTNDKVRVNSNGLTGKSTKANGKTAKDTEAVFGKPAKAYLMSDSGILTPSMGLVFLSTKIRDTRANLEILSSTAWGLTDSRIWKLTPERFGKIFPTAVENTTGQVEIPTRESL
jgi:hypothetical protein